jgi:peptide/nickel transport system substrate-binding protein
VRTFFARLRALLFSLCLLCPLALSVQPGDAAAPIVTPTRGGTLVDGLLEDPDHLLPNFSRRFYTLLVQQVLFAPLFYSDDHGVIQPGLASAVPSVQNGGISSDGRTYTFHLRRGLRWSDGTALTARDVDFSWRLWTNPRLASSISSTLGFDHIGGTTISSDGLTIIFHLVQPYAPFVAAWTDAPGPLPAHTLGLIKPQNVADSGFALAPNVNSGPFTLSPTRDGAGSPQPEVRKGDRIVVVRNRFYYRTGEGYPYLDSIVFRIIHSQAELLSALRKHTVDVAWLLPISDLDLLRRIPGIKVLPLRDGNWEAAIINLRRPLFQDVRVRQALQYGLDRGAEIRNVWHGMASPIGSDQPPSSPVYAATVKPYPYNPVLAGRLLDQAGWRLRADGFRHKGKAILSMTYSTTFNNPWRQADEAEALNSYERLGIQVVIRNYPAGVFLGQILPRGTFDLAEYVFNNSLDPDDTATFGTRFTYPLGVNYGAYSNPAFDRLAGQELTTVDPVRRADVFHQMQQLLHDDAPDIWLYSPYDLAVASTRVHNYQPGPFSQDTWNAWQWFISKPAPKTTHGTTKHKRQS